jgi:hypothetical protein
MGHKKINNSENFRNNSNDASIISTVYGTGIFLCITSSAGTLSTTAMTVYGIFLCLAGEMWTAAQG